MLKSPRSVLLLAACAAAVPLAGCAHGGSKGKADTAYVAERRPVYVTKDGKGKVHAELFA